MNTDVKNRKTTLLPPAWMEGRTLIMLDQTRLPEEQYLRLNNVEECTQAIKEMRIRGSGALALAGIYGLLLAAYSNGTAVEVLKAKDKIRATRPTAVNMHTTVEQMCSGIKGFTEDELIEVLESRAEEVMERQLRVEKDTGTHGAELLADGDSVLTICNAGAVAGFGFGGRTLSVFRTAQEQGKKISVIAAETRPYLQGARITAWELERFGIPVQIISDNMAGAIMQKGLVSKVITGSDRIAANGDTANKIGTYLFALAARDNNIPFYVSTSRYNVDPDTKKGGDIEIEMRDEKEVLFQWGKRITPEGVGALYPGFDVTPNDYISGIITEYGVLVKPYVEKLTALLKKGD
jgi:methylthioribose-1-phosphate isomerase